MAPDHPPAPAPNGWSRPNAHAASQQSKTSQYIDKITSENEKLKRELNAERLAREDEAKRVSAARSKAEDSRAEHQHLQLLVDTNARALERKDRKLDEMKAQLDQETKRRKAADQRAEEALTHAPRPSVSSPPPTSRNISPKQTPTRPEKGTNA